MKILYKLLRADMIRRMKAKGWKEQRINTVLRVFDLTIELSKKEIIIHREAEFDLNIYPTHLRSEPLREGKMRTNVKS